MICEGFKTQIQAFMVESLIDKYSMRANRLELLMSNILTELWDLALTLDFKEIYFSIFFTNPLIKEIIIHQEYYSHFHTPVEEPFTSLNIFK